MNWEQLQKDVEAYKNASELSDQYALENRAPNLAALALAGRDAAKALEDLIEELCEHGGYEKCEFKEELDAIATFRKAEGESHE